MILTAALFALAMFNSTATDACGIQYLPSQFDGRRVVAEGLMIRTQHSAHLESKVGPITCVTYLIFPATPGFLTPSFKEQTDRDDPALAVFVDSYVNHLRKNPEAYWRVSIDGTVKVIQKFDAKSGKSKAKFGYYFRTAIVINTIKKI